MSDRSRSDSAKANATWLMELLSEAVDNVAVSIGKAPYMRLQYSSEAGWQFTDEDGLCFEISLEAE